jgi:hypothetical protein
VCHYEIVNIENLYLKRTVYCWPESPTLWGIISYLNNLFLQPLFTWIVLWVPQVVPGSIITGFNSACQKCIWCHKKNKHKCLHMYSKCFLFWKTLARTSITRLLWEKDAQFWEVWDWRLTVTNQTCTSRPNNIQIILQGKPTCRRHKMTPKKNRVWGESDQCMARGKGPPLRPTSVLVV